MDTVRTSLLAAAASLAAASVSSAAYMDNFDTDTSANYNISITAGATGASSDATFAYDYSTQGIPAAPNQTGGSTLGIRVRVDNLQSSVAPAVVGAVAISPKALGFSLTAPYSAQADIWANYNNPSTGATNSTVFAGLGIAGTTSPQTFNSPSGFMGVASADGNVSAGQDYRVYTSNGNLTASNAGLFAAGNTTGTGGSQDNTNTYYATAFPGGKSAPAVQQSNGNTATVTPNGIIGFAWHTFKLTNDGTNLTYYIDSTLIATLPVSSLGTTGQAVSLTADDTGLGGIASELNFFIFDNLVVTPEPTSLALLGLASTGVLARRRRA